MLISESNLLHLDNDNEKNSTLKCLSQKLFGEKYLPVYNAFLTREEQYSTGLVDGFAIPHAKLTQISETKYYFVSLSKQVEWNTLDGTAVKYLVVLLIPNNGESHIKILSAISRLMMKDEFKEAIKNKRVKQMNELLEEAK